MPQPTAGRRRFGRDIARTRRLLKRLPGDVERQMLLVLKTEAPAISQHQKQQAPVRTGRLRAALSYRVNEKALRAEFGLIGRKINRKLFYAWILEVGRRGGPAKRTTQRRLKNGGLSRKFRVNVRAIPKERFDFVFGRAKVFAKERIVPKFRRIFERALGAATRGAGA